jgi:hypothetical protein
MLYTVGDYKLSHLRLVRSTNSRFILSRIGSRPRMLRLLCLQCARRLS